MIVIEEVNLFYRTLLLTTPSHNLDWAYQSDGELLVEIGYT